MNINLMNLTQEDIEAVIEARKEKARDQRLHVVFTPVNTCYMPLLGQGHTSIGGSILVLLYLEPLC